MADTVKQYFPERQGRGPKAEPLPFPEFRELVINVFDHFREQHYMQEAFGYNCVDAGDVDGTLGSNPSAYFMRTIRRRGVWPYWEIAQVGPEEWMAPYEAWDEDTLFDVVEVMRYLISRPVGGRYHDYAQCGWHYETFDAAAGQTEFREEMNGVLRLHDPPYEMNYDGMVVEAGPAEFHTLLTATVPPGTEPRSPRSSTRRPSASGRAARAWTTAASPCVTWLTCWRRYATTSRIRCCRRTRRSCSTSPTASRSAIRTGNSTATTTA
jgi:hypothetical protein